MGRLTTFTHVTLDGVMQAPGRPDEDTRGKFGFGGWEVRYGDRVMAEVATEGMATNSALLFGRRTYEDFHGFWPNQPQPNPFSDVLDRSRKYVASTTLGEPLPWANSTLLPGDAGESVARLKAESDADIVVLGSGNLVRTLMWHRLIDEYVVLIHPLVLGTGQRLFDEGGPSADLRLDDTRITTTGVIIATYRPAD
ncbi:MAG TPA: dihydrofolate reductase family protein [Actinomycetota bacterium]|nr:dihydrofolate reductase family protein [Actinomycetota bacterium]